MKLSLIFSFSICLFVSLCWQFSVAQGSTSQLCIVTSSAPSLLTSPDRQSFLSLGHSLAVSQFTENEKLKSNELKNIVEYKTDSSDTGNLEALQKALADGGIFQDRCRLSLSAHIVT